MLHSDCWNRHNYRDRPFLPRYIIKLAYCSSIIVGFLEAGQFLQRPLMGMTEQVEQQAVYVSCHCHLLEVVSASFISSLPQSSLSAELTREAFCLWPRGCL